MTDDVRDVDSTEALADAADPEIDAETGELDDSVDEDADAAISDDESPPGPVAGAVTCGACRSP